ncbi:GlxA family transcriptional regulator [Rhizobium leguminosarum]|uniref:Transcriptional regulator, AraC family n=1 Tax=Rhizobium leguminosarum bv. trifolii (strain WSM1325) TaxID=395491 RepID=C6ATP3_RHILS|nr:GlxA family transcriptional regulator [Rhizobium leguminosarum]ACS57385.1 transcriptional regulator, AraC family [Rhizobium leguminosarum bv. trifolii WSM1325]MBY2905855.1 GlxA family transcriptional regulator [Rhizobium leguminosarum]MBY2945412.1 GlxA family transcriptional regulator [Rhizobium leguminosarum]MBY2990009.1 GlxA family transcriptional regulator [Rhizobium leguminosarum]MBY3054672.1 GlxA family transcriptional regulator [Rhizobium leguminosarum]
MTRSKTIAILAVPGVQLLDVSGPLDVFAEANVQTGREVYRPVVIAVGHGHIRSSSGVRLVADYVIGDNIGAVDTLLVAGCPNAADIQPDAAMVAWLRSAAPAARRYGSVCSGAFLLAATGLLDGRRVTTHWAVADRLAEAYPDITVEADAIHVRDGQLWTAAGVTAGLDLALALVEEDLGHEIAMKIAGQLVMFFKRPGGQMQFSRKGEAAPAGRSALQEVQRWIAANPAVNHSVATLAQRMELSPRHFARLFRDEVGMTPAAWVEAARISAARRLLEEGHTPKQVAVECGFADADTLRRAFARQIGVTPAEYRKRHAKVHLGALENV